ncbi:MAG: helix-turn-helix transcriptional regulator [Lachnospiraceae bacterium]|nr:helix-turn-helix transcriptional regulator [Lachnospiraceae bacterium]
MLTCFIGILTCLSCLLFYLTDAHTLFLITAFAALIGWGHMAGQMYHRASILFFENEFTGRIIGFGMGCGVLLQFVVQNALRTKMAFPFCMVVSVPILLFYFNTASVCLPPEDTSQEHTTDQPTNKPDLKCQLLTIMIATVAMTLVITLIDGVVVQKHAQGSLSVSSYARLFYALSLPVAGYIADIRRRCYLPLATVCVLFISTIATALMGAPETFFPATVFMYIYSGFYVMYLTLTFIDAAPQTKMPALWAGMGRILRSLTTAVMVLPTLWLFQHFGAIIMVIGSCLLSIITLLLLLPSISRAIPAPDRNDDSADTTDSAITQHELLCQYFEHFHFTPRESEVFEKLIDTEDGVQEIADSLYVSRRVLQRYIASIYEKTGTKSRVGLFRSLASFSKTIE